MTDPKAHEFDPGPCGLDRGHPIAVEPGHDCIRYLPVVIVGDADPRVPLTIEGEVIDLPTLGVPVDLTVRY